jgi:hypothetical protein
MRFYVFKVEKFYITSSGDIRMDLLRVGMGWCGLDWSGSG